MRYNDRVNYICEDCGKECSTVFGRLQKKLTNCCSPCATQKTLRGMAKPTIRGENHYMWGGGIYQSTHGYNMVKTDEKLPSGKTIYKREHILKMEEHLGRKLNTGQAGKSKEQVHHIDGNKTNNNISNLILCSTVSEHKLLHSQLQNLALELVRKGTISFDKDEKKYYITPEQEKDNDIGKS